MLEVAKKFALEGTTHKTHKNVLKIDRER